MRFSYHTSLFLIGCLATLALPGCYNSGQMIERARNSALATRLEEVDLGSYRITLPLNESTGSRTELVLELVGTARRYRTGDIEKRVESQRFLLRQGTIAAARLTTPQELADPQMTDLRKRLLEVTNAVLGDDAIDSLAISELLIIPQ